MGKVGKIKIAEMTGIQVLTRILNVTGFRGKAKAEGRGAERVAIFCSVQRSSAFAVISDPQPGRIWDRSTLLQHALYEKGGVSRTFGAKTPELYEERPYFVQRGLFELTCTKKAGNPVQDARNCWLHSVLTKNSSTIVRNFRNVRFMCVTITGFGHRRRQIVRLDALKRTICSSESTESAGIGNFHAQIVRLDALKRTICGPESSETTGIGNFHAQIVRLDALKRTICVLDASWKLFGTGSGLRWFTCRDFWVR